MRTYCFHQEPAVKSGSAGFRVHCALCSDRSGPCHEVRRTLALPVYRHFRVSGNRRRRLRRIGRGRTAVCFPHLIMSRPFMARIARSNGRGPQAGLTKRARNVLPALNVGLVPPAVVQRPNDPAMLRCTPVVITCQVIRFGRFSGNGSFGTAGGRAGFDTVLAKSSQNRRSPTPPVLHQFPENLLATVRPVLPQSTRCPAAIGRTARRGRTVDYDPLPFLGGKRIEMLAAQTSQS